MSSRSERAQIALAITVVAFFIGIIMTLGGVATFSSANYSNPVDGAKESATGILMVGIGMVIILVLIKGKDVVSDFLDFLREFIPR